MNMEKELRTLLTMLADPHDGVPVALGLMGNVALAVVATAVHVWSDGLLNEGRLAERR